MITSNWDFNTVQKSYFEFLTVSFSDSCLWLCKQLMFISNLCLPLCVSKNLNWCAYLIILCLINQYTNSMTVGTMHSCFNSAFIAYLLLQQWCKTINCDDIRETFSVLLPGSWRGSTVDLSSVTVDLQFGRWLVTQSRPTNFLFKLK